MAEWLRQGTANPCTGVRFPPPPPDKELPLTSKSLVRGSFTKGETTVDAFELVDHDRYPVWSLARPAAVDLVAKSRAQLQATGSCELPGFLTETGLNACQTDARSLEGSAHEGEGVGTAYLEVPDPSWPREHPRRRWCRYRSAVVAYDQFDPASPIRSLYESNEILAFLAAVLRTEVYRYADPLGALNLAVMTEADELQWHYDQTDFVVSLALQSSVAGGNFEVLPRLRADGDERYEEVGQAIDGVHPGVVQLPMIAGTLLLFAGRTSLHRVSPVAGTTPRLVALMGYDTSPGTRSTETLQLARYGRAVQ